MVSGVRCQDPFFCLLSLLVDGTYLSYLSGLMLKPLPLSPMVFARGG